MLLYILVQTTSTLYLSTVYRCMNPQSNTTFSSVRLLVLEDAVCVGSGGGVGGVVVVLSAGRVVEAASVREAVGVCVRGKR